MRYSFFGTCFNDYSLLYECLNTILKQTISPNEIILVNSGDINIEKEIQKKINSTKVKLIYIHEKLSRVKSLNLALNKSTSKFSFRFDTRSRFACDYAENALNILSNKEINASVVGGVPFIVSNQNKFESNLCAEIMKRSYVFFFPKHRNKFYNGYSSSLYLGCFYTSILKKIQFNEKKALLSEDSLIINDFLEKGYKAYISSNIKLSYVSRSSLRNIFKLFHTYGFCRSNTILISKKLFISKRHFFVFFAAVIISLILLKISVLYLMFMPFLLIVFNVYCEIIFHKKELNLFVPICGTLCQFFWVAGFLWSLVSMFRTKQLRSNFIS